MIIILIIFAHFFLKLFLFAGLRVSLQAPASVVSLSHDALMIFPFLFVSLLGMYSSVEALIILIILEWAIILGLLPSSHVKHSRAVFVNIVVSRYILIFCSSIYLMAILIQNPGVLYNFSLESIFVTANENSIARYSSTLTITPLYRIGVILAFAGGTFGGYYASIRPVRLDKIYSSLPLVAAFCDALLMGARSGFLILLFVYMASYYVGSLRAGRITEINYRNLVPWLLMRLSAIFIFFVFVQLLRGGDSAASIPHVVGHVLTWFFGHVSAFSVWIDDVAIGFEPLLFGGRTFAGLVEALGFSERVGGTYLMASLGEGRQSNVFTAYRGVFEDFSIVGGVVFIFFISLTLSFCLLNFNRSSITFVFSVVILTFFAWSFVISIWTYNSIVFGQFLAAWFIKLSTYRFE